MHQLYNNNKRRLTVYFLRRINILTFLMGLKLNEFYFTIVKCGINIKCYLKQKYFLEVLIIKSLAMLNKEIFGFFAKIFYSKKSCDNVSLPLNFTPP